MQIVSFNLPGHSDNFSQLSWYLAALTKLKKKYNLDTLLGICSKEIIKKYIIFIFKDAYNSIIIGKKWKQKQPKF